MTDDHAIRLVRVNAMATAAQIRCAGMVAENAARQMRGEALAYPESAFLALLTEYGLDWNTIVGDTRP